MRTDQSLWRNVIGQARVKNILLSAIKSNRLPHAYLFVGNEGVGKEAMAFELARVLHCDRKGEESCGECASCLKMRSLQHPDLKLIIPLPTGKGEKGDSNPFEKLSAGDIQFIQEELKRKGENPYYRISIPRANTIKINSIRELRRESSMSTLYEGKKIFVIANADEMAADAANTLLKTLEEPPGDTLLILTTARPEMLLPTIISRCQVVRFDPLTEEDICSALVEREKTEERQAILVARLANGSYVRALELLQADVHELRADVVNFIRIALTNNHLGLSQHIEKLAASKDREFVVRFLTLMLIWFRDAFVMMQGGEAINVDQQDDLKKFTAKFSNADLRSVMTSIDHCISLVYKNGYILLALLQLSVKLRRAILEPSSSNTVSTSA